ncbi:hypothetical protein BS17DRAFT_60615 [Gyrodon lividus]|nr:hypothetical protein BS17DRAFT_60615 [Gyrodon lividus]
MLLRSATQNPRITPLVCFKPVTIASACGLLAPAIQSDVLTTSFHKLQLLLCRQEINRIPIIPLPKKK